MPTREEIDAASRTPALETRADDTLAAGPSYACPFINKGTVSLERIEVTGATLVSQSDIQAVLANLVGKQSDLAVLCEARDRVAQLYATRGEALARVDIPEQRISDEALTLAVTEGRIVDIEVRNGSSAGPAAVQAARYFAPLEKTHATRWRDVERAVLLSREIPGFNPAFTIRRAGDGTANGLSAVAALGSRRLFDITVNGNNFGSPELGREGLSVRIDANSFTALAERTSFIAATSSNGAQSVFQLLEEFRVGPSGTTVFGDLAYSESKPKGVLEPLDLEGRAWVGRFGLRHPLVRSRALLTDVAGKFEFIDQKNDLGFLTGPGGESIPLFRDELRVVSAQLHNRWRPADLPGFRVNSELELRKGIEALGAKRRGDPLLSRADARPDFLTIRFGGSAGYVQPESGPVTPWVSATVTGQWSPHGLPAYEEFQTGNYTVGRGYDPGAASGDSGIGLQLEAGADLSVSGLRSILGAASFGLFGFYDMAKVWNEDPLSYDAKVASLGGGLRARFPRTQISLIYANPRRPPFPTAATPGARALVTLSRTFSIS